MTVAGQPAVSYTWDNANRLMQITQGSSSVGFGYDNANRRSSLTLPNGLVVSYNYDNDSRLTGITYQMGTNTRRTRNAAGKSFLFDGPNASQELSGSTVTANLWSGGLDELFQRTDSNGTVVPLADALGSTISLVNSSGSLATMYSYDPFGNTTTAGATSANPSQYTGRENEGNGLYFYRNRYYSPTLGRFISEDPAEAGDNFYIYADDDPIDWVDPLGLVVSAPGFGESLIPIWGSGRQSVHDFQCGHYAWGTINAALAVSDVFLVKSLFTAAGKVGVEGLVKVSGSFEWKNGVRPWLNDVGWSEFKGQQFHHWLIPQGGWGELVPNFIKNQPWNLMRMPEGAAGDLLHDAIHGWGRKGMRMPGRLWHGSPTWAKVALADAAGKSANLAGRSCGCE
jgi:RHS repeat-associated protein